MSRETIRRPRAASARPRPRRRFVVAALALAVVSALALIFAANLRRAIPEDIGSGGSGYQFQVGSPGPGEQAPSLQLSAADGSSFDVSAQAGDTVLLYFQEGLMCQPCWDQLTEIEASWDEFTALGIDQIATITTDPIDLLRQARVDEAFTSPVLSDTERLVSAAWGTLDYGMMGDDFNGHSFIVVGPDGNIRWRADYGGAPDYTMYLPVPALLADITEGFDAG